MWGAGALGGGPRTLPSGTPHRLLSWGITREESSLWAPPSPYQLGGQGMAGQPRCFSRGARLSELCRVDASLWKH